MLAERQGDTIDSPQRSSATLDVIVNPAAGNGSAGRRWPEFRRELEQQGYALRVHMTTGPGDATSLARRVATDGGQTLVCVGGDGTVNEVVNGLIADDAAINPDLRLAILSSGTGKDLVRTLGTRDFAAASEGLSARTDAWIDVGVARYVDSHTGQLEARYFVNVADTGIGASVAERINRTSKRLGGLVTYLRAAVRTIVSFKAWDAIIEVDGEVVHDGKAGMVVFANGRYFAGGMFVAPDASPCDGLIDVFVLHDVGKRRLLTSLLPRVYRGRHVGQPGVTHAKARTVTVRSSDDMLVELDGEQVGRAPVSVTVLPRALRVVGHGPTLERLGGCA